MLALRMEQIFSSDEQVLFHNPKHENHISSPQPVFNAVKFKDAFINERTKHPLFVSRTLDFYF